MIQIADEIRDSALNSMLEMQDNKLVQKLTTYIQKNILI